MGTVIVLRPSCHFHLILSFLVFTGYLGKLVSLVAHFCNVGRMADKNDTFTLIGKITKNLHNFFLGITVKVACRLVGKDNIGIIG